MAFGSSGSRRGRALCGAVRNSLDLCIGRAWLRKPKRGFSIPLRAWIRGPLSERVREAAEGAFAARFFRRETLERWRREHAQGLRDRSEGLWAVLMFDLWWERWGKG